MRGYPKTTDRGFFPPHRTPASGYVCCLSLASHKPSLRWTTCSSGLCLGCSSGYQTQREHLIFFSPLSTRWITSTFSASDNARRCLPAAIARAVEAWKLVLTQSGVAARKHRTISGDVLFHNRRDAECPAREQKKPKCRGRIGSVRDHVIPMHGRATLLGPTALNVCLAWVGERVVAPKPRFRGQQPVCAARPPSSAEMTPLRVSDFGGSSRWTEFDISDVPFVIRNMFHMCFRNWSFLFDI